MPFRLTTIIICALLLFTKTSFAACSNNEDGEPGQKGEIEFFTPENILRYCNGTIWIDMVHSEVFEATGSGSPVASGSCSEPASLSTQLSAYYDFENGSGSTLSDQQGSLNGTLTNFNTGTAWVAGKEGNFALDFDGTNDWVSFPTSASANFDTITVSFWIKPDVVTSSKNGIALIENRVGSSDVNYELSIDGSGNGTSNDGRVKLSYFNGGWRNIVSSITPVVGQWHHISFTVDPVANTYAFYLNGVQTDSGSTTADLNSSYSNLTLALGKSDDTVNNDYYNGQMDGVRLYSRVLSPTEIQNVYLHEGGNCSNLIGYWRLDETSGTNMADSSAVGNTGNFTGTNVATDTTPGVFNAGVDVSDDPISIASNNKYGNLMRFSASFWVKATGTVTGSQGLWDINNLFSIRNKFNNDDIQFITRAWSGAGTWSTTTDELSNTDWTHVVITYDYSSLSNNPKFYINGSQQTSGIQENNSPSGTRNLPSSPNILLGRRLDSSSSSFQGALDDVRLYNKILSAAEVSEIYNQSQASSSLGLVGHWTLDETSGSTAADSSGTGNVLTMQGGMTGAANTTTGRINNALVFDGSNDYLENTSPAGLPNGNEAFTISTWVKSYTLGDRDLLLGWGEQVNGRASILAIQPPTGFLRYTTHGTGYDWDSSATITANTWHHIAITHENGSNDVKFYLDGQYVDTITNSNGININQNVLEIGNAPTTNDPLDGELDDVRIYDYALTPQEIETLATCRRSGTQFYNFTADSMQFCGDIITAYNMGDPASGSGACGGANEGSLNFNETTEIYEFCDGNGWVPIPDDSYISDGMIAHWPFNETSGSTFTDQKNGYNGNFTGGSPDWVSGKIGNALRFDAAGEKADVDPAFSVANNSFTIMAWVRRTQANAGEENIIFAQGAANTREAILFGWNDNKITCGFWNDDIDGNTNITNTSLWYHIACSYDANTNTRTVYLNGIADGSDSSGGDTTATGKITIGDRHFGTSKPALSIVDDLKVFNSALSASDIYDIYADAAPEISFVDSDKDETGAASRTYSNKSLGTPSAGRMIAVAITYREVSTGSTATPLPLSSVTIAGQSATQAIQVSASQRTASSIWYAQVDSGSTGDIVLNGSNDFTSSISVFSFTGLNSISPIDTDSSGSSTAVTSRSNTLDIQNDGVGICVSANANDTANISWAGTNIATESNILNAAARDHHHSSATILNTSGSNATRTYTSSWSGAEFSSQVCASWK